MSTVTLNLMAGKREICPVLDFYYHLPPRAKLHFLEIPEAIYLFSGLPQGVSNLLREGFLQGAYGGDMPGWEIVVDFFQSNSEIIPALTENPGTFTMLERMYHFQPVVGVIDNYFLQCLAGGQALKNRYEIVTATACQDISGILDRQRSCLVADFGSGPGRNAVDIIRKRPDFKGNIRIDCIDIDQEAIRFGESLVQKFGIRQVRFLDKSMVKLRSEYNHSVDYGLLIGVLCGMDYRERVFLLKNLLRYFRPGGKLVAAALLDEMAKRDLLCAYILRETAYWELKFRPLGDLKRAFEEAGWRYEGYFQDQPSRLYEIGIGVAP